LNGILKIIESENLFKIINNEKIIFLKEDLSQMELYDLSMKMVLKIENHTKEVNLNNLSCGIYFLKFSCNESVRINKIRKL